MKPSLMNRRQLLLSSGLLSTISANSFAQSPKPTLAKNDTILFQGDSVTDCRRDRKQLAANHQKALGSGYPLFVASSLLGEKPKLDLKIYNRGVSGNRVPHLHKRWETDTLALKPSILSILIGVNDIWHKMTGQYDGTVKTYEQGYDDLIVKTKKALPETTIVICEPFVMRCGAVKDSWFPEFDERRAAAQRLAEKHQTLWVPFQSLFDQEVAAGIAPQHWAKDGVHPSFAAHSFMAQAWRKVVGI